MVLCRYFIDEYIEYKNIGNDSLQKIRLNDTEDFPLLRRCEPILNCDVFSQVFPVAKQKRQLNNFNID